MSKEEFSEQYFVALMGKIIEVYYKNAIDYLCNKSGRVEIDRGWMYLYKEGKSGNNYCAAFKLTKEDLSRIKIVNIIES